MTEKKTGMRREGGLGETIRRELGSQANRLFLARMPGFKPDADLPDRMIALLEDLDRAEANASRARG